MIVLYDECNMTMKEVMVMLTKKHFESCGCVNEKNECHHRDSLLHLVVCIINMRLLSIFWSLFDIVCMMS